MKSYTIKPEKPCTHLLTYFFTTVFAVFVWLLPGEAVLLSKLVRSSS